MPGRFPCRASLTSVGLWEPVNELICLMSWDHIATRRAPTYKDLVLEFLSTFRTNIDEETGGNEMGVI